MSIYSALEGRSPVNAELLAQRSRAAAKAAQEEKEQQQQLQEEVEHRMLTFFPKGIQPVSVAPPPPPPQPRVIPSTPKLLSNLHARTPSVSPFTRMGLDFPDDATILEEHRQHSDDAEQPQLSGSTKAATFNRTDAKIEQMEGGGGSAASSSPSRSLMKNKMAVVRERRKAQRESGGGGAAVAAEVEEPHVARQPSASIAAVADIDAPRSRRIISHAQQLNRTAAAQPLSPSSATAPITSPPPQAEPSVDEPSSPSSASSDKRKPGPASAFLQHLAGLIKTPQQAPPQLHRRLPSEADPDAPPPTGYVPAPFNPRRPASPPPAPSQLSPTPQQPSEEKLSTLTQSQHSLSSSSKAAPAASTHAPADRADASSEQEERRKRDVASAAGEAGEDDDGDMSTPSSSTASPSPVVSGGEEDELCASLSSMWRSAKRRQDRALRPQLEAAAERREHRERFGKSLVTAGLIVAEEGERMSRAERRLVRKGKRKDSQGQVHRMTLEQRKAVKLAAVYRQQQPKPAEEEHRQPEEAAEQHKQRHTAAHLQTLSPSASQSSSGAARREGVDGSPVTVGAEAADRLPVPAFSAAPLPTRPATDVVFGRTTALSEEERSKRAKRQQRSHSHAPSLFDLAYGTESAEQHNAEEKEEKRRRKPPAEAADDENVQPSGLPLSIPVHLLVDPGRSSHVVKEGIAKGLPMSLVPIARTRLTPSQASAAHVSHTAVPPPPVQAIHHHKASSVATASAAASLEPSSTLSHIATTFPKAPRSPLPAISPPSPSPSSPSKRPRLAPKTKERLDRLHAAHRARQARLEVERAAKEAQALDGCTFAPVLAPKTGKMADKKRLQDELLVQQWETIKAKAERKRMDEKDPTAAEGEESKAGGDADGAVAESSASGGDGKRSRVQLLHDQYLIQQEQRAQQKAVEEQLKAEEEISRCTFDPFASTRTSRRPSVAPSPPTSATPAPRSPTLHPVPPRSRTGSVTAHPRRVNGSFSVKRTAPSYEEQLSQAESRQQQQQQQQQHDAAHAQRSDAPPAAPALDLAADVPVQKQVVEEAQREVKGSEYAAFAWAVPAFSTHPDGDEELVPDVGSEDEHEPTDDIAELAQHRQFILTQTLPPPTALGSTRSSLPRMSGGEEAVARGEEGVERAGEEEEEEEEGDGEGEEEVKRDESTALLSVDVAIAEGRVEQMQLYDGDDIFQAAAAFVARHGLHPGYAEIIEAMLHTQLQDALNAAEPQTEAEETTQ